jgi:uncharacterized protein (DUF924 family)
MIHHISTAATDLPSESLDYRAEDVLQFWFPIQPDADLAVILRQWIWWFRGGADTDIIERFSPLLERAARGELDTWACEPQSRLALIIILDQFPRSLHRGTPQAYAQDPKACALVLEGIDMGHYAALETPWEKTFFILPLGHSEDLTNSNRVVKLAEELVLQAPPKYRALLEFSASQARASRDVIAKFGRHPHRNEILGRQSTPEELNYLANEQPVHTRSLPLHLQQVALE